MVVVNDHKYKDQVRLLLQVLPYFMREPRFALKGGTAINLFYQNMPRLSVDIDLTYLPIEDRKTSLTHIDAAFDTIVKDIRNRFPSIRIQPVATSDGNIKQVIFREFSAAIKVEINHILRGIVNECQLKDLCANAQETFNSYVRATCLSPEDLYAGKICAALDRQHPRDLFDIKILFEKRDFDDALRKTFIVYLISNNRPISELINPHRLDIKNLFENEFIGMSLILVTYDELIEIRERLIEHVDQELTDAERQFLVSFKSGEPNWERLNLRGIEEFPAVKWKLQNIKRMDTNKNQLALNELKRKLRV